jgi:hypothetical protein
MRGREILGFSLGSNHEVLLTFSSSSHLIQVLEHPWVRGEDLTNSLLESPKEMRYYIPPSSLDMFATILGKF